MRLERIPLELLLAATLPPVAVLLAGRAPASRVAALASIVVIAAGLAVVHSWLRRVGLAGVAAPAALLVLYGTALTWHELVEPDLAAATFLAGAIVVRGWAPTADIVPSSAIGRGIALGLVLTLCGLLPELLGHGAPALSVGTPAVLDALFSSRHGMLFWTPVLTVGVAGLVARAARGGGDAAGALSGLAVMALVGACLRPWWSGGFANARGLPALPLVALGLAQVLHALRTVTRNRPLAVAAAAGGVLVAWNLLLMAQYGREMIPRDDTVSFPAIAENAAQIVGTAAGAPVTWPASWIFAARHDLPAARYDLVGGQDVLAEGGMQLDLARPETEAAVLGESWSVRHRCGAEVCREVEGGHARLFLPVVDPAPAEVTVRAQGSGTLVVTVNGRLLARAALGDAFAELGGAVPASWLRRGPNEVRLETAPGGRAAVAAVRVQRADGGR